MPHLIRFGNRVLNISRLSHAWYGRNRDNELCLVLWFNDTNDGDLILKGQEAATLWRWLQSQAQELLAD